jgi:hypothetical protein
LIEKKGLSYQGLEQVTRYLYDNAGNLVEVLLPEDWSMLTHDAHIVVSYNSSGLPEKVNYMWDANNSSTKIRIIYTFF